MITAMVKAFLSKDLASKFTAARKSRKAEDTEKFKDTELWNCMKGKLKNVLLTLLFI